MADGIPIDTLWLEEEYQKLSDMANEDYDAMLPNRPWVEMPGDANAR